MSATNQIFKYAFIIGPDFNNAYKSTIEYINLFCRQNSCFMLGNGRQSITFSDLRQMEGRLDSSTKVHILAHGLSCLQNDHCIQVGEKEGVITYEFIEKLQKVTGSQAMQISLHSCYAGLSLKSVPFKLTEGSVFTAYGPSDVSVISDIGFFTVKSILENSHDNPFQAFINNMVVGTITQAAFRFKGPFFPHGVIIEQSPSIMDNPQSELESYVIKFQQFYDSLKQLGMTQSSYLTLDSLQSLSITPHDILLYRQGAFLTACNRGDGEWVKDFANNHPVLFSAIINQSFNGTTTQSFPLYLVVRQGSFHLTQFLLEQGADVNQGDSQGWTPLMHAVDARNNALVKLLIDFDADIDQAGAQGETPLLISTQHGDLETIKLLAAYRVIINHAGQDGTSPLMMAVHRGYLDVVQFLLEQGADVNQAKNTVDSNFPLQQAIQEGHIAVAKLLLEYGANVNVGNNNTPTPMILALYLGSVEMVKILTDAGADAKMTYKGVTAMTYAQRNYPEAYKILHKAEQQKEKLLKAHPTLTPLTWYLAEKYLHAHQEAYADRNCQNNDKPLYSFIEAETMIKLVCEHNNPVHTEL